MASEHGIEEICEFLKNFNVELSEWQKEFVFNLDESMEERAKLRESAEGFKQIGRMREVKIQSDFTSLERRVASQIVSAGESYIFLDDPLVGCDFASPNSSDKTVFVVAKARQCGKSGFLTKLLEEVEKGNLVIVDEVSHCPPIFPELPTPQIEDVYKFEKEEKKSTLEICLRREERGDIR